MKDYTALNNDIFSRNFRLRLTDALGINRELTIDGPISPSYGISNPKVLWILREANSEGGGSLIDWVNQDLINNENIGRSGWFATWGLIIKVSDAILNGSPSMSDTSPHMLKSVLNQVAVINLNKFGGGGRLSKHYKCGVSKCKGIVDEQIIVLQPNIIIWAGTGYTANRLGIGNLEVKEFWPNADAFPSIRQKNRIHISAYHSGQRRVSHSRYYQLIAEQLAP